MIQEEDGDANSDTGPCTDHSTGDKHHPHASKDGDSQEEQDTSFQHEEATVLLRQSRQGILLKIS